MAGSGLSVQTRPFCMRGVVPRQAGGYLFRLMQFLSAEEDETADSEKAKAGGFGGSDRADNGRGGSAEVVQDIVEVGEIDGRLSVEISVGKEEVRGAEVVED